MKIITAALLLSSSLNCLAAELAPECPKNPYAIQPGAIGASVTASLPPSLAGGVSKPGANTVKAAVEFSRSMYAAMAPSVVREVLAVYTCLMGRAIDADETKTVEQKMIIKDAWKGAVNDVTSTLAIYVTTTIAAPEAVPSMNPVNLVQHLDADARSPAPYLSAIKEENFTIMEAYTAWANATISGLTATACGSYLRTALAANAGNIQRIASLVRPVMLEYFDQSKNSVRNAKALLYAEAPLVLLANVPSEAAAKKSLTTCASL